MFFFVFSFLIEISFGSISLKDAYTAALNQMETLKKNDSLIEQSVARKNRALGLMSPTISAVGTYTTIDPPPAPPGARAFTLTRQYSSSIRLDQPLLRGGSLSAYQLSKDEVVLQNLRKDSSKIEIATQVINLYFEFLILKKDLEHLNEMKNLSLDRLKEMKDRVRIGKSRQGEFSQTSAQVYSVEAEIKTRQRDLIRIQEIFNYLTGLQIESDLEMPPALPEKIEELAFYQNELKKRPDILAAHQEIQIAQQNINIQKGGHLPSLDLFGNYYLTRTGILEKSEWDLGLRLNFPLFQGGTIQSAVREASEKKRFSEINSVSIERTLTNDLDILYRQYIDSLDAKVSFENSYEMAKKGYFQNLQDFKYGLITNLELLQSMNLYIDNKRIVDRYHLTTSMIYYQLQTQIGRLP